MVNLLYKCEVRPHIRADSTTLGGLLQSACKAAREPVRQIITPHRALITQDR